MQPFRIEPNAGPEAYKTYAFVSPKRTHFRKATCREVECDGYRHGFAMTADLSTELGQRQAAYLRSKVHGRTFTEERAGTTLARFVFPAGQPCFKSGEHVISLQREPVFLIRDGDYRGNPRGTRPITRRPSAWVDDFATHQQRIADATEKG